MTEEARIISLLKNAGFLIVRHDEKKDIVSYRIYRDDGCFTDISRLPLNELLRLHNKCQDTVNTQQAELKPENSRELSPEEKVRAISKMRSDPFFEDNLVMTPALAAEIASQKKMLATQRKTIVKDVITISQQRDCIAELEIALGKKEAIIAEYRRRTKILPVGETWPGVKR